MSEKNGWKEKLMIEASHQYGEEGLADVRYSVFVNGEALQDLTFDQLRDLHGAIGMVIQQEAPDK